MDSRILNRTAYAVYLLALGLAAALLLAFADRLPMVGPWVGANTGLFLLFVGGAVVFLAALPFVALLVALSVLVRTARRACDRLGAGDAAGAHALLRRLERWTPRLRWMMLNPAQVDAMRGLVCGVEAAANLPGPPAGAAAAYVLVRTDADGNRFEIARFATRGEAEAQREELEQIAEGHRVLYSVEGPVNGKPAGPVTLGNRG